MNFRTKHDKLPPVSDIPTQVKKMRNSEITAVVFDVAGGYIYSGDKRGEICQCNCLLQSIPVLIKFKGDFSTLVKTHTFPGSIKKDAKIQGHVDHVFCLALSHDGKYLVSTVCTSS